jgi:hypothetical protein
LLTNGCNGSSKNIYPEISATTLLADYKIYKLLDQDDDEGPTFTIQFFFKSLQAYKTYTQLHLARLQEKTAKRWKNQSIFFCTAMQLVK